MICIPDPNTGMPSYYPVYNAYSSYIPVQFFVEDIKRSGWNKQKSEITEEVLRYLNGIFEIAEKHVNGELTCAAGDPNV